MKRLFVLLLVAGAFAAACEQYDDSAIKDSVSKLEDRVAALESLSDEVASLKDLVTGQLSVLSCEEKEGVYTVTFSDGSVVKVNSGMTEIPVITVFKENNKTYWGYYQGGQVQPLLYKNEKVEVTAVTPSLKFNDEGKLEISVDGGRTWVESEGVVSGGIFTDLRQENGYVTLVLADGFTEIVVPLEENRQMIFMVCTGKQYFKVNETKSIPVEMVGVERYTITEVPKGWSASLSEGTLKITAPSSTSQNAAEGHIKMVGVGDKTDIAQVYVAVGTAPCLVTVNDNQEVTIQPNPRECYYGACLLEDFDPKAIVKTIGGVTNPMLSPYPFTASKTTMPLTDLVEEVVEGETYIVWVMPTSGTTNKELDIQYQAVTSIGVKHEVSNVTFEDARISVEVKGTDKYYLVLMYDDMTVDNVIEDLNGNYASTYDRYLHTSAARIRLSDVVDSPIAGSEYSFLVLPVKLGQYQTGSSKIFTVKLNELANGGSTSISFETQSTDFKTATVKVTAPDAYKCYVTHVSKTDYDANGYADNQVLMNYLSTLTGTKYSAPYIYEAKNLDSGEDYYIVGVSVDRNGLAGIPVRHSLSSKSVVYIDDQVTATLVESSMSSAKITLSSTAAIVKYRYFFLSGAGSDYWYYTYVDDDAAAESALVYGTVEYIEVDTSVAASGITFTDLIFGTKYIFRAIGYDKDAKVTHMAKLDVDPTVGQVVKCSDAKWIANKPSVTATLVGTSMQMTVNFPNGCNQYVMTKMSSEEFNAALPSNARQRTDYVLSHSYAQTYNENISKYVPEDWYIGTDMPYILIAWEDENGWYEPIIIDSATGEMLNK